MTDARFNRVNFRTATPEQIATLEEVHSLRGQSLATTADIFRLIKAEREIERFLRITDPVQPFNMDKMEFVTFCNEVHAYAQHYLQLAAIEFSTYKNGGTFTLHCVLEVHQTLSNPDSIKIKPNKDAGIYVWHLNYPAFFRELFESFTEYERKGEDSLLAPGVVADIMENNTMLTSLQTKKPISLSQFKSSTRYRSVQDSALLEEKYISLNDGKVPQGSIEYFKLHKGFAELSRHHLEVHSKRRLEAAPVETRKLEVDCLYKYKEMYLRAKAEGNLNNPATARSIALAFVMDRRHYSAQYFTKNDFPFKKLAEYVNIIRKPKSAQFLSELTPEEAELAVQRTEMGEYIYQALKSNREFLKKYFSS